MMVDIDEADGGESSGVVDRVERRSEASLQVLGFQQKP